MYYTVITANFTGVIDGDVNAPVSFAESKSTATSVKTNKQTKKTLIKTNVLILLIDSQAKVTK